MHMFAVAITVYCLALAESTSHSGHDFQLHSVPDIDHYGKLIYPHFTIHELGEYSHGGHHPEIIKVIKTVEVKVPTPYPVKVPHKIPYPVAYKVPHIIKVPQIVKVAHPVPVEVVKEVSVPKSNDDSYGIQNGGGDYGKGSLDSASFSSLNDGHQSGWQGNPSGSFHASTGEFNGAEHGFEARESYDDYSAVPQTALLGQNNAGHFEHDGDYNAEASSSVSQHGDALKTSVDNSGRHQQDSR